LALFAASLPSTAGLVLQPAQPELTVNICHPLQSVDRTDLPIAIHSFNAIPFVARTIEADGAPLLVRVSNLAWPPDSPPPKATLS